MSETEYLVGCPLCGADYGKAQLECACCGACLDLEALREIAARTGDEKQVYCHACRCTFPAYMCEQSLFEMVKAIRAALVERNGGRNLDCWPLCSFGWKDADLEASGCTGIKAICGVQEDRLEIEVGGHKTIGDGSCLETESQGLVDHYNEIAQDLVCGCGFGGEWTGDEWVVSYSDKIAVSVVNYQDEARGSDIDPVATAHAVIKEAHTRTEAFEAAMVELSERLNCLYDACTEGEEDQDG